MRIGHLKRSRVVVSLWIALVLVAFVLVGGISASARAAPSVGRVWFYGNITAKVSPHFSFTLMPGVRAEFARGGEKDALGHYMDELFVGPNLHLSWGTLSLSVSLWYYFAGFDILKDYVATHSLEVVPTFRLRLGRFTLSSRTIFHNTFYSGLYASGAERRGYGLVLREKIQLVLSMTPDVSLLLASEPFFGLVEDGEAKASLLGFWSSGFHIHRLYAGVVIHLMKGLALIPQGIYETRVGDDGAIDQHGFYLFMTLAYRVALFGA